MLRDEEDDLTRLPGLYRSWDLAMLIEEGRSYRIEDGGRTEDGEPLYAVYASNLDGGPSGRAA